MHTTIPLWEILSIYLEGNRQCVDFLENQSAQQQTEEEEKEKKVMQKEAILFRLFDLWIENTY